MTSARSWTVREATEQDDSAIAELFKVVFGYDRGVGHASWKFRSNPEGPPVIALAEDAGRVVGQYALWPMPLSMGGTVIRGAQSLDTMTHPDYRGQGMFTVLAEECMGYAARRGIELLFGFPNENSYPGFVRRLDWDHAGDLSFWVRPLRPAVSPHLSGRFRYLAGVAALLPLGRPAGFEVRFGVPTFAQLDELLQASAKSLPRCAVVRTAERLLWRFDPLSGMAHEWVCAQAGGRVQAVAVWCREPKSGEGMLSELIGSSDAAVQAALAGALQRARQSGVYAMHALSSREDLAPAMKRCGFFRRRSGLPLILRKLTARTLPANTHQFDHWGFFGADHDSF